MPTSEQRWYCDDCRKHGLVRYPSRADVLTVVHKIETQHERTSPRCDRPVEKIRAPVNQEALDMCIRIGNARN
jgi:hypothetical protein